MVFFSCVVKAQTTLNKIFGPWQPAEVPHSLADYKVSLMEFLFPHYRRIICPKADYVYVYTFI